MPCIEILHQSFPASAYYIVAVYRLQIQSPTLPSLQTQQYCDRAGQQIVCICLLNQGSWITMISYYCRSFSTREASLLYPVVFQYTIVSLIGKRGLLTTGSQGLHWYFAGVAPVHSLQGPHSTGQIRYSGLRVSGRPPGLGSKHSSQTLGGAPFQLGPHCCCTWGSSLVSLYRSRRLHYHPALVLALQLCCIAQVPVQVRRTAWAVAGMPHEPGPQPSLPLGTLWPRLGSCRRS